MTVDAVGGVWRYAMDLAAGLAGRGVAIVFAGLGPAPSPAQRAEAEELGVVHWLREPLDWMADDEAELDGLPEVLARLADQERIDLLHLNLPSQAYRLDVGIPVVVVSHSCVGTWFRAVRGDACPPAWRWHETRNREGLAVADAALAPSRSHARALTRCYGPIPGLDVAYNTALRVDHAGEREPFVLAAGRWWDDGKNGAILDQAAADTVWPVRMAGPLRGPNGQAVVLDHAHGLGDLPVAGLRRLMSDAGVFASPSVYEPFGLAALEAALAGTPLVLADIATYRELWDGAALFADPRDPRAWSEALNRLASSDALRRDLGARALERSREFAPARQLDAVLAAYDVAGLQAGRRLAARLAS